MASRLLRLSKTSLQLLSSLLIGTPFLQERNLRGWPAGLQMQTNVSICQHPRSSNPSVFGLASKSSAVCFDPIDSLVWWSTCSLNKRPILKVSLTAIKTVGWYSRIVSCCLAKLEKALSEATSQGSSMHSSATIHKKSLARSCIVSPSYLPGGSLTTG